MLGDKAVDAESQAKWVIKYPATAASLLPTLHRVTEDTTSFCRVGVLLSVLLADWLS